MIRILLLLLLALLLPAPALAKGGMVSAADPRAAEAGREILRAGGTATDAAIATMLALTVVEPQSSGIGGGGFMLVRDGKTGAMESYDGRETAPAAAGPDWFFGTEGRAMAKADAVPGGRSVGVPGNLRLAALAHRAHGTLPWARLFAPAIRLADQGFAVTPRLFNFLTSYAGHVDGWARGQYFSPDGAPKPVGTVIRNPLLADTLRRIAARGADSFYVGPLARAIVATVNGAARNPSKMTEGDLATYGAKMRPAVCGMYRVWKICGVGPPASGATTVFAILKQLERSDLAAMGPNDPVAWHLIAQSMRLAYADRDAFVADPAYVTVPVAGLIDPAYLARRAAAIAPDHAVAEVAAGTPAGAPARIRVTPSEVPATTHMAIADGMGGTVTYTSTIEGPFGSGLTVGGFFLNNELTDFDLTPERDGTLLANRVEGGKRPRSSMSPTIVYGPDGRVRLAIGAAGGGTIIAQVAKALIGVLDWKLSAEAAIALPQIYAPGATVLVEKGSILEAMVPRLTALGDKVVVTTLPLKANAVERVGGAWVGAADPRSEGVALAE